MQIVILCGGLATRLGDLAKNTPKSMIDIDGKPFLEHQIDNLKKQGIKDIILCVGHLSKKIIDYFGDGSNFGVNIKYSHDGGKPLGPIGALKKAESLLDNLFFIMYGDSYVSVDFDKIYNFFMKNDKPVCMVVYKNYDKYDKSNLIVKENLVVGYGDKNKSEDMVFIDYGISLLTKKILEKVPLNKLYSTGEFFDDLIGKNELLAFEATKRFYHIGNHEALEEFRSFIR